MLKKILLWGFALLLTAGAAGYVYLSTRKPNALPAETVSAPASPEAIARGRYLFTVGADCDGCHSQRDWEKFAGPIVASGRGKGFEFPAELGLPGRVIAANITPDVETGIGAWTDGEIVRAIREGVSRDGRALFPMMPYQAFAKMSDSDVLAVVAYMKTIPPVRNALPRTELNFPVNFLIVSAPAPARKVPEPDVYNKVEWGRHLVTLAGCDGCHTRREKGEAVPGMEFAGGEPFTLMGYKAVSANITPDQDTGIGKMSEDEFVERFHQYRKYLQEGPPPMKAENFTIMPWLQMAQMPREELSAMYAFLRTVKPVNHSVETRPGAAK